MDIAATDTNTPDPKVDLLKRVKDDYESWVYYTASQRIKWTKNWKLYNNIRVKRKYRGTSDTFDPMTHQMVETGVDNVYGSQPKMTFVPRHRDQEKDTKMLTGMWDFTWRQNNLDLGIMPLGRETKIVGNSAAWGSPSQDGDYMDICHVPFSDCIFDPAGVNEQTISFGGYRHLELLEDLKARQVYDPKAKKWIQRYTNLDSVPKWGKGNEQTEKEIKDCYMGSTLNPSARSAQIEIITMYYRDKIVEVANRAVVVYEGANPWHRDSYTVEIPQYEEEDIPPEVENTPDALKAYLESQGKSAAPLMVKVPEIKGFIPVALNRRFIDSSQLISKSDVDVFADTQEDLNDTRNMKKDNIAYNVKNVAIVDTSNIANAGVKHQLANANPGDVIEAKGGENAVGWMKKPDMTGAAENEIAYDKQSIRDSARISEIMQGVSTPGDNKTATEVNTESAQANGGFSTEVKNLEAGFYKRLGEMFIVYLQVFVDSSQLVRVLGQDGVEWRNYDPKKFWGLYDSTVMLETRANAKKQKDAENAKELYADFKGDPDINQVELKKKVLAMGFDMDADEVDLLLMNTSPTNTAAGPTGAPVGDVGAGTASAVTDQPTATVPPAPAAAGGPYG